MAARSSRLRRIAALAALAPRLVRLAHHAYSDRLLDAAERALAGAGRGGERGAGGRGGRWRPGVVGTISYRFDGASQPAPLTTPDPIALQALLAEMRAAGTTHVALEVSSHALAQERVTGCRFDAAVFTNLTRDHLDFHGDLEHYGAAKARLFLDELPASGKRDPVAVVNVDDPAGG